MTLAETPQTTTKHSQINGMSTKLASTASPSNEATLTHSSEESASARKPIDNKKRFIVIYRRNTTLSSMCRLFCWGGSTSVSTASAV